MHSLTSLASAILIRLKRHLHQYKTIIFFKNAFSISHRTDVTFAKVTRSVFIFENRTIGRTHFLFFLCLFYSQLEFSLNLDVSSQ